LKKQKKKKEDIEKRKAELMLKKYGKEQLEEEERKKIAQEKIAAKRAEIEAKKAAVKAAAEEKFKNAGTEGENAALDDIMAMVDTAVPRNRAAAKPTGTGQAGPKKYTLERLRQKPPECDAGKLEIYLTNEQFERIFKMTKEKFYTFGEWKQQELKKKLGLF